jgi:GNAT superfamily N-acetyltransferase
MHNEPVIRLTRPSDINALMALDLKTHHYPLTLDEWQAKVNGSGSANHARVVVCDVVRVSTGFAMWKIDNEHEYCDLMRIGVLRRYRLKGLGSLLVHACLRHAFEQKCDKLRIIVPHIICNPGDPDDASEFLGKCFFKATGVIDDWCEMYGKNVDGYVFERKINVLTP